jgi:uncharacterized protein (DUF983 family)
MKTTVGTAITDDHWTVDCPDCGENFEYEGFFASEDVTECTCGCKFRTKRIEFENGDYIK